MLDADPIAVGHGRRDSAPPHAGRSRLARPSSDAWRDSYACEAWPRFLRGMAPTACTTTGIAAGRAAKETAKSQVSEAFPTLAAVAKTEGRAAGRAMETS